MSYSALELAVSGDVVRALRALVVNSDCGLGVVALGPAGGEAGSLWQLVLGNHRLTVRAYGSCDGTLQLCLIATDEPRLVEVARDVAPVTWKAGELRATGLRPAQALDLIRTVHAYLARQADAA